MKKSKTLVGLIVAFFIISLFFINTLNVIHYKNIKYVHISIDDVSMLFKDI